MIRKSVNKIGTQLEQLTDNNVPVSRAFEILSRKARSIEEIVVVEVMREVYLEMSEQRVQAESITRSARMPSIAFRR